MARQVRLTPSEYREKHARRTKAAVEDMKKGVARVTEAPGAAAAAKEDKMRQKLNEALDSGKWKRNVAAVPLEEWKSKMINKGAARVAAGIDEAGPKVEKFGEQLISHQNSLLGKIDGMPDLTLEDSVSRATEWIRGMAKFEFRK